MGNTRVLLSAMVALACFVLQVIMPGSVDILLGMTMLIASAVCGWFYAKSGKD